MLKNSSVDFDEIAIIDFCVKIDTAALGHENKSKMLINIWKI